MTAIIAHPPPALTVDTLRELADSELQTGGWGHLTKQFFTTSLDEAGRRVGRRFKVLFNPEEGILNVSKGVLAYYENAYFLEYTAVQQLLLRNEGRRGSVHLMSDCVINAPISLGLKKNSPIKNRVDALIARVVEGGLVQKWLADAMLRTNVAKVGLRPNFDRLVTMRKLIGAILALAIGYLLSFLALLAEIIHFQYLVLRHPLYNRYNPRIYYSRHKTNS